MPPAMQQAQPQPRPGPPPMPSTSMLQRQQQQLQQQQQALPHEQQHAQQQQLYAASHLGYGGMQSGGYYGNGMPAQYGVAQQGGPQYAQSVHAGVPMQYTALPSEHQGNGTAAAMQPQYQSQYLAQHQAQHQAQHGYGSATQLQMLMLMQQQHRQQQLQPWRCAVCTYRHIAPHELNFMCCAMCGTFRN